MDSYSLLQGIFPTQGSNPSFLHCGQILYQLNHQGSLNISVPLLKHYSVGVKLFCTCSHCFVVAISSRLQAVKIRDQFSISFALLGQGSVYRDTNRCTLRDPDKAGPRKSWARKDFPSPQDTHIVGFSDQPLLIVQNMADAAHQLHGAAVICVLKESKSKHHIVLLHAMGLNLTSEQRARPQDGGDAW